MTGSPFRAIIKILIWKKVITRDEGKTLLDKGLSSGSHPNHFETLVEELIEGEA